MYNLMMPGFEPDRLKLKVTAYSIVPHTLLLWSGKRDQIFFKHFIVELSGSVCAYHAATLGSNTKHNVFAF